MENYQANEPSTSPQLANEVKSFYQHDFKGLLLTFFRDPLTGLYHLFSNPPANGFVQAMILLASVFVLYFAGSYLLVGGLREFMGFSSFLSIGLTPVLIMVAVAALSFAIKLTVGKADFKSELLTGALCGLPLGLIIVVALVLRIFGDEINPLTLFSSPLSGGWMMAIVLLYLFLMMINVLQQSLRAGGLRDVRAWYLAPIAILVAVYVAMSVVGNLF